METKEKIATLTELVNRFGRSANPHENDYLFNVLKDIRKDYQEKEGGEELNNISEETAQKLTEAFEQVQTMVKEMVVIKAIDTSLTCYEKYLRARWFLPRWWRKRKWDKAYKISEQKKKDYAELKQAFEKSCSLRNW